jgi:hypothetical protein
MSRPYTPGGRFDTTYETEDIHDAITKDLTNPVGTSALWYVWDIDSTHVDSIYDVGASDGVGRKWKSPVKVPVIKAVLGQGTSSLVQQGFYNADNIHFTIDHDVLIRTIPEMLYKLDPLNDENPDPLNRDRIVWKNQVYRPLKNNYAGIIAERFTLLTFECQQIMPEEMVNDSQFQLYAN